MKRMPLVTAFEAGLDECDEYDIFLCTLGYETRARFIAETQHLRSRRKIALGFPAQHVLKFDENRKWFQESGFEVSILGDAETPPWLSQVCVESQTHERSLRICCDISSMSRFRVAAVVDTLRSFQGNVKVVADFLYSFATFTPPPEPLLANMHIGPVLPAFAGWASEPDLPVSAIVGLGYEPDKALGAVEHLQASEIWAFEPRSHVSDYGEALRKANHSLLEFVPERQRLQYHVERPLTLFSALRALTISCFRSSNPVILPFGPKLFTLVSLLVAASHPDIAVWRVSAGILEVPVDRLPDRTVIGLSVEFVMADQNVF